MPESLFSSEGLDPEAVEAAREELRRQLPELRKLPGFPIGSDEDILRMSVPPYYTACPNPFIEDWLKETTPDGYEAREYVDPGPFVSDVSEGKGDRIYKAHSFWTKVPHKAIMRYILHYTRPGDVVVDGFCGSGMTGVAAQLCGAPDPEFRQEIEEEVEWGTRRAVLQDLSPVATYISAGLNLPVDAEAFDEASQRILDEFEAEWGWMYETAHTDGSKAKIDYTVWSEVFTCPNCGSQLNFFERAFDEATEKVRASFDCGRCGAGLKRNDLQHRITNQLSPSGPHDGPTREPVRIMYRFGGQTYSKAPDSADIRVINRIRVLQPQWFPDSLIPVKRLWHGYMFGPREIEHLAEIWPDRSLLAIAFLWDLASKYPADLRRPLLFWVEQSLWGLSWMNRYRPEGYSQVSQFMSGVYYFPALVAECHPRYNLAGSNPNRGKRRSLVRLWHDHPPHYQSVITATASSSIIGLPDESADYVFVDPPFGLNIQYSDINLPVESWHRVRTNYSEEAVVHRVRGVDIDEYSDLLGKCFAEFFRVLKPGRWMTVEFSNSSNEVWLTLQGALARVGFVVADTRVLDKQQHSWIQVRRPNAVKTDIVLSAYKPSSETEKQFFLVAGTTEGAWEFVREHLSHLPVSEGSRGEVRVVRERMADRLYDRMVAYHVHRGVTVPLTAAEFYSGVEQRFPVRDDMYFLSEQVEAYERHRMTVKELIQAELFITNEQSAVQWLRQLLKRKPRPYAEIQPVFFGELQAGLPEWEALPELRALLDESFLQDDQGRWYVPDPKKSEDLEKLRTRSLLKEFEVYRDGKGRLDRFRSEAVRAGFKEAWARRDFAIIVAVGKRLPDDAFVEDEALLYYYDNARRLAPS